jgi:hypothetical protein
MRKLSYILIIFVLLIATKHTYSKTNGWDINMIGEKNSCRGYSSIALDQNDYPHITYYDHWGGDNLRYSFQDKNGWHTEVLDEANYCGQYSDIAIDSQNNPHIIEHVADKDVNRYLKRESTGFWITETLDNYDYNGIYCRIAIDSLDDPIMIFEAMNDGDSDVSLVFQQGGNGYWWGWAITKNLDRHMNWHALVDLTLGEYDRKAVSYFEDGSLMIYVEPSSYLIDPNCGRGYGSAIRYDKKKKLYYIAYHNRTFKSLCLALYYPASKTVQLYTMDNSGGEHPAMCLDQHGYPHIAYYAGGSIDEVRYIYYDDLGWHQSTVADDISYRVYLDIDVNSLSQAYICYSHDDNLYLAKNLNMPVVHVQNNTPSVKDFKLHPNYPNPFNASTTISYELPKVCPSVTINIFNAQGQKVDKMNLSNQSVGLHSIHWDASSLPSGMYVCQINTGEYIASQKLILMK